MSDGQLQMFGSSSLFDAIRKIDGEGLEYWTARELMIPLGYSTWRRFAEAIDRAKFACINSGNDVNSHFASAVKMDEIGGSGNFRSLDDYRISRYGCYLTAMNGDPRKPEIAAAQTYFAIRTHEAETRQVKPEESEYLKRLQMELMIIQARCEEKRLEIQLRQITAKRQPKEPKQDPIDTQLMVKVLDYAKANGKITDRILVAKRWVATAKEARKLITKLAELGHGSINKEARVCLSLVSAI